MGQLIYSPDPSKCVDLLGGDWTNGNQLGLWDCYQGDSQMWDCYGGDSQMFSFQDGQLVLSRMASHKCVDLLGGDSTNGNQLGLWDCNQGDSQMWGFDEDSGTLYLASSKASDAAKCVQTDAGKGDPLVIWDCTGEPQQIWKKGPPPSSVVVV